MDSNIEKLISKRFQTTMIGALYQFEKNFGYLWGIDIDNDDDLTDNQLDMREIWDYTRNSILNNGNNQLRKVIHDLDTMIGPIKYNYTLKQKQNPHKEEEKQ